MEDKGKIIAEIAVIPPKPRAIAEVINKGYPNIQGNMVSDITVSRKMKDGTIATRTESGTAGTMTNSANCFCDGACDLVGIEGLTFHLMQYYPKTEFNQLKRNVYRLLDKQIEVEGKVMVFPKNRLWKDRGGWVFCTNSVDHFMRHYLERRGEAWVSNLQKYTDVSAGTIEG